MSDQAEFDAAFEAASSEALRGYVRGFVWSLDDRLRRIFLDGLNATAARTNASFSPPYVADPRLLEDVHHWAGQHFDREQVSVARLDSLLGRINRQYVSGQFQTAQKALEMLFWGLDAWETAAPDAVRVDEILEQSLHRAGIRYLMAVWFTSDADQRAAAVLAACDLVMHIANLRDPVVQMREESPLPLGPEFDTFEHAWQAELQQAVEIRRRREDADVRDLLGWLSKSMLRTHGPEAARTLARLSGDPVTWEEWIQHLVDRQQWTEIGPAVDEAIGSLGASLFTARLADVATGACCRLNDWPVAARWAERAFEAEPSVARLLTMRTLLLRVGLSPEAQFQARIEFKNPRMSPRVHGTLLLLTGHWSTAAAALGASEGLGWSTHTHPGAALYPALLYVVQRSADGLADGGDSAPGDTPPGTERLDELTRALRGPALDELDGALLPRFRLPPELAEAMPPRDLGAALDASLRRWPLEESVLEDVLDGLRAAAFRRAQAVLEGGRRRVYGHACQLLVALAELLCVLRRPSEARALLRRAASESTAQPAFLDRLKEETPFAVRHALRPLFRTA